MMTEEDKINLNESVLNIITLFENLENNNKTVCSYKHPIDLTDDYIDIDYRGCDDIYCFLIKACLVYKKYNTK